MGYNTTSTNRTTAASAVSSQVVVVNTGDAGSATFSAVGSTVKANTSIQLGVTTVGQTSSESTVAVSSGPAIANVQYLDENNSVIDGAIAVSTLGGNILINGTGFVEGSKIYVDGTLVANTFISSTQIQAELDAGSTGNVSLFVVSPTYSSAMSESPVRYSGAPSWTTAAAALTNNVSANIALAASSDSTLTYTLQSGSTLPGGISLDSTGYLYGTPTGYVSSSSGTFILVATDEEGQATQQTINWSVAFGDESFMYNSLMLTGELLAPSYADDASSNNFALVPTGDVRPSGMTPYTGYPSAGSMYVASANSNYLSLPHTTATTIVSGSTDSFSAECWVYFTSATASTAIMDQSGANTVTFQNWSLNLDSAKKFQIIWGSTGSPGSQIGYISGTTVAASNTWYHLAYVKTNNVWSLFVNGTREATYTGLNTANDGTSNPLRIGSDTFAGQSINGYIADVRIYKGATVDAPYNASSTTITVPTAPLTATTNTQLLTCQYNRSPNNSGFVDDSDNKFLITRAGNASAGSFTPYGDRWSYYFVSGYPYIAYPSIADYNLGTGDFTIEFWFKINKETNNMRFISNAAYNGSGIDISWETSNFLAMHNSAGTFGTTALPSVGRWHHIAWSRTGTTLKVFLNGVLNNTYNSAGFNVTSATQLAIGGYNGGGANNLDGNYISNVRIIKGTGLYTEDFTPSATNLTAVTNTVLLTCQNNRAKDNSANNATPIINGIVKAQSYSPFSPSSAYSADVYGASASFDGSGDYLTLPLSTNLAMSGDYTVEAWVYLNSVTGVQGVYSSIDNSADTWAGPYLGFSGTSFLATSYVSGADTITHQTTVAIGQWYHIAICRSGSTTKSYLNGVQSTGTTTSSYSMTQSGGTVGSAYPGTGALNGYISGLRVVKGTALYTSSFTPPTTPPTAIANTQLLMNFDSAGVYDKTRNTNYETVGSARVVNSVKKYGTGSILVAGGGNTASLKPSNNSIVLYGAFTIEFWVYLLASGNHAVLGDPNGYAYYAMYGLGIYGTTGNTSETKGLCWMLSPVNGYGGNMVFGGQYPTLNTWTHMAVSRDSSNNWHFFKDGVKGTTANSNSGSHANSQFPASTGPATAMTLNPTIGNWDGFVSGGNSTSWAAGFNGYIDDLRITNGVARYTANFTPPDAPLLGQ